MENWPPCSPQAPRICRVLGQQSPGHVTRSESYTEILLRQVSIGIGGNINIISVALSGIKGRSETLVNISSVYTTTTSIETVPEI